MEKDIRNRVKMVTAKAEEMNEQTGIFPSLREEDINEYLQQVIEEIKKTKEMS